MWKENFHRISIPKHFGVPIKRQNTANCQFTDHIFEKLEKKIQVTVSHVPHPWPPLKWYNGEYRNKSDIRERVVVSAIFMAFIMKLEFLNNLYLVYKRMWPFSSSSGLYWYTSCWEIILNKKNNKKKNNKKLENQGNVEIFLKLCHIRRLCSFIYFLFYKDTS